MTYTDINRIAADKFKRYTLEQCEYAICDINATLGLHDYGHPYTSKLYAELDAARDRRMVLQSKSLRTRRAVRSAHLLIDSL
jgi:hypothetical protein